MTKFEAAKPPNKRAVMPLIEESHLWHAMTNYFLLP